MKKNIYYLIGFILVLAINYLLKESFSDENTSQLNIITFYKIIDSALKPIGIYLLIRFFSSSGWKFKTFVIFYTAVMLVELTIEYFMEKQIIDYNFLIGVVLGFVILFFLNKILLRFETSKQKDSID